VILTLTVNPAIDRNVTVDRLAFEDRAYILETNETPGGRGINASRVIHTFGGKTLAIAAAGGAAGKRFQAMSGCCSFPMELVAIAQEMRTNLTVTDKQGLTVKLNELGPPLKPKELDKIAASVEAKLGKARWLMICGSLPPGVPPHFYTDLLEAAHKKKEHPARYRRRCVAARPGSRANHRRPEPAGGRAAAQSRADYPLPSERRGGANPWNGRAVGGRLFGQPRSDREKSERND
jgi:hypothetical protein